VKRKYCGRWLREQWYSGQSEPGPATSLLGPRSLPVVSRPVKGSFGNPHDPRGGKSLILGRGKGRRRAFGNYPFSKRLNKGAVGMFAYTYNAL
jgi:hypothetical protein